MSDTIYRQDAIDALDGFRCGTKAAWKVIEDLPSAHPETHDKRTETHTCDLINRKMAIDAMRKLPKWNIVREGYKNIGFSYDSVMFALDRLPSAQPEIIRCMDCKWFGECPVIFTEDDFCSRRAERRSDE